ncbi:hypothetical protein D3C84_341020 [compost metagenome]
MAQCAFLGGRGPRAEDHLQLGLALPLLQTHADVARRLQPLEARQQGVELGVGPAHEQAADPSVVDAVHRLHRGAEYFLHRVAGLDDVEEHRGGNRRHQRTGEAFAAHWRVGDGRAVVEGGPGRQACGAGDDRGAVSLIDRCSRAETARERVAGDDLPDLKEHRCVGVADLHQIQQHLALPRIAHGHRVVEAVARHRTRPDTRAASAGQPDRCHTECRHRDSFHHACPPTSGSARTRRGP